MLQPLKKALIDFYPFAKKELGFNRPPRLFLRSDHDNAKNVLGRTAHYDPQRDLIVLYITNRHPKDVLRSFAHELVHHAQNCRGELSDMDTSMGYAQNGKGEKLEKEAYLGTKMVRDWEDSIKIKGAQKMSESKKIQKETIEKIVARVVSEVVKEEMGKDQKVKRAEEIRKKLVHLGDSAKVSKPMNQPEIDSLKKELAELEKEIGPRPEGAKSFGAAAERDIKEDAYAQDPEHKDARAFSAKIKKKLDPVGKEDDDVDNDGDVDKTDKYLKNRRKAIGKAMKGDNMKESKEETTKKVIKEKPQPKETPVSNDNWYWGSLYEKLKNKWTK
jgi:hypothetical protein